MAIRLPAQNPTAVVPLVTAPPFTPVVIVLAVLLIKVGPKLMPESLAPQKYLTPAPAPIAFAYTEMLPDPAAALKLVSVLMFCGSTPVWVAPSKATPLDEWLGEFTQVSGSAVTRL